ncbi:MULTISPECIES: SDR family NAD(P)-dependent oxidoreductase [Pontibacter]|uniref:NADP-dependent 3-hydroxy acid dehydrogenase YdfG n=2 Tax=Pontibacter TaxID=323449 RepID=A0A239JDB7_9BACT|nr:SDR family NAD(P)-dependent oxidoreductase [Pontibacter ummariensis]PRY08348.1 NADP-dependent 3-hydroxy acid dehydrogenase YdfG [Pontibacter ummariensis]SNT03263.1 NADP-dependent 3-hydroxy acid dehydrogenase YdfG [Pontibacter ummariensis]
MNSERKDKTIVLTGGSSGIGAAAARILTETGAWFVIPGRSGETKKLAAELDCDYYLVDYSSFSLVKKFAQDLLEKYPQIDVLVNNVGGVIADRHLTEDGHEMTLQVNHLSGFLLTNLLKERLEESKATVINTSSLANVMGKIDFNDLENEKSYSAMKVYGTAKLMNILHAMEINRRFKGVSAASFHPGAVSSGFAREGSSLVKWFYETPLKNLFLISPEKGADTLSGLFPVKQEKTGSLVSITKKKPGRISRHANATNAEKLWEASEKLIGEV